MMRTWTLGVAAALCTWASPADSIGVSGRFVRIELPGADRILSVAEVQVYRANRNIALQGTAKQATTLGNGYAERAVDGNVTGNFFAGSVSHTTMADHPSWELDLGSEGEVSRIVLFNRTDCCQGRIVPAKVSLLNGAKQIVWQGVIDSQREKYAFHVVPTAIPIPVAGRNLLRNASFRERTNPPLPDYWDLDHVAALTFRNLHEQFGVDESIASPVPGTSVLKVVNSENNFPYTRVVPRNLFAKLPEGPYTFSVYLRSNRDGARLNVRFTWADGPTVVRALSNEWKRYTMTIRVTSADAERLQPVLTFPEKGTYYIAAPQLESGAAATAFVPFVEGNAIDINTFKRKAHGALGWINGKLHSREKPKLTALFEYDFYTADSVARLVLFSNYGSQLAVSVRCDGPVGGTQARTDSRYALTPGASTQIEMPISGWPNGDYTCHVEAFENGTRQAVANAQLRKLPPGLSEIRVNRIRRFISLNGTPFFIIGMGVGSWKIPDDWYFEDLANHGINTVFYTGSPNKQGRSDLPGIEKFVARAARQNLKVIVGIPLAGAKPQGWQERLEAFSWVVEKLKDNQAVIGWFPVDEPAADSWRDEELAGIYRAIKRIDPYRPIFVNWAFTGVPAAVGDEPLGTLGATDVYSSDYYPFSRTQRSMDGFISNTVRTAKTSQLFHKVSHSWLQLFGGIVASREPTGDELGYMAYLSFAYGSMVSYWDTKSNSSATWARLAQINSEIQMLANELFLNPDAVELVAPVHKDGFMHCVWRKGRQVYLMVLNDRSASAELHVALADLPVRVSSSATVFFSDRRAESHAGYLDDNFMPYEGRIYVFDVDSPLPTSAQPNTTAASQ